MRKASHMNSKPRYTVRPVTTPVPAAGEGERSRGRTAEDAKADDPFIRPEAEDDDGYDPYSDRPADPDPAYQDDPWR